MNTEVIHSRRAEHAEFPQREVTDKIIGAALEVHRLRGARLLESVDQRPMQIELGGRGVRFQAQTAVPLVCKTLPLPAPWTLDLLIEAVAIVEIRAVQSRAPVHAAQLLTYSRLTGLTSGLLPNLKALTFKPGIQRVSNSLRPSAFSAPLL